MEEHPIFDRFIPPIQISSAMKQELPLGQTTHRSTPVIRVSAIQAIAAAWTLTLLAAPAAEWKSAETDGRLEIQRDGKPVLGWQSKPLSKPTGGEKFVSSAFIHPLQTPSGFVCTNVQPADHLHHLGLWWPWKFIEVGGAQHNIWEIQEGQGAHVAKSVKHLEDVDGSMHWEFLNEVEIRKNGKDPQTVIRETAHFSLSTIGEDMNVIDLSLRQKIVERPVNIINYRYSGFSWRGPASWNKDNSVMTTSEGRSRDDANGTAARWAMVSGPTPSGKATVVLMSAAVEIAAAPERLRVWDSKAENGAPFINFNPVMEKPLPLDDAHPAVSQRVYRVLAADREITAEQAEAAWQEWNRLRAKRGD